MELKKYQSFKNSVNELEVEINKLSALLTSLGAPKIQLNNEFETACNDDTDENHIIFPDWFKRSPYSRELPDFASMTAEQIERRDKFIDEWDTARFCIMKACGGVSRSAQKNDTANAYDFLNKGIVPAQHIKFPAWFKQSPYASELDDFLLMSADAIERHDKFANEWDLARFQLMIGKRRKGEYKVERINGVKTVFIKAPVVSAYWGTESPTETWPEVTQVQVPKEIIEQAISYTENDRNPLEALGGNYYRKFNRIMIDIFDLERAVCGWKYDSDNYEAQSLVDEVVNWLDENIGRNKYVGKFHVTEYAELLQERIYDLSYCGYTESSTVKNLARDIDHLAFRVCTYFGYFFENVKEDLGSEAEAALKELQENGMGFGSYYKLGMSDYYDFHDEYDEDDVDENDEPCEDKEFTNVFDVQETPAPPPAIYEYDDDYPFFELTGLKVVNYQTAIVLSLNISFEIFADSDATVVPLSITTKSAGCVNKTNSYSQVHRITEGMKHLSSFLVLDAKSKSDLCGKDIELAYYTSEMKLCTALYKCDMYGNFMFMDWKNRSMNETEIADYKSRLAKQSK